MKWWVPRVTVGADGADRRVHERASGCRYDGRVAFSGIAEGIGLWRSLVAHLTGGQGVAGSNPVSPTV